MVAGWSALAGVPADAAESVPTGASALLAIDQNRASVVDRVVREWGDALAGADTGIEREQLRAMLMGLRADHLLAASLAGSLEGLRDSLARALTAQAKPGLAQTKALGDTGDDLVYTPVVPCRRADTRVAGGAIAANTTRNFAGYSNTVSGDYSIVGGGYHNTASGAIAYSTVGGGATNTASGVYSTVPGGSPTAPAAPVALPPVPKGCSQRGSSFRCRSIKPF